VRDIVIRGLKIHGYECASAAGPREALLMLERRPPAVVISDINMPGENGLWLLARIKDLWPDISVIMLTAIDETQSAVSCLTQGADDYIVKPINLKELAFSVGKAIEKRRLVIENKEYQRNLELLVEERTIDLKKALQQLKHSYNMTLHALVASLDAREHKTSNHSQRVCMYAIVLAKAMGLKYALIQNLSMGALLHDIGKLGVPDSILLKPGELTEEEWKLMRRHPEIGWNILRDIDFLEPALDVVLNHHEQWDGRGYPAGLKGESIPRGARIFLVVDALDTITTDRPYRAAVTFAEAFDELRRCRGTQFDPDVVDCFLGIPATKWHEIRRFTLMD
ncbi:MAG: HD domain-containing phosphohydrolase, partial [Chlamydiota bacterium]